MKDHVSISMLTYAPFEQQRSPRVVVRVAGLFIALHPLLVPIALYATWLAAFVTLGHPPRCMTDDPKSIGLLVDLAYVPSVLLLAFWYIVAFLAVALMVMLFHKYGEIARLSLSMGCLYLLVFLLLHWDPGDVLCWFMD